MDIDEVRPNRTNSSKRPMFSQKPLVGLWTIPTDTPSNITIHTNNRQAATDPHSASVGIWRFPLAFH